MTITQRIERVVEGIETEARALDPAKAAKTAAIAPFVIVGMIVGIVVRAAWIAAAWAWTAMVVGYRLARKRD